MLRPLTLKDTHTYKYVKLDEDGLKEIFNLRIVHTGYSNANSFSDYHLDHPGEPVKIRIDSNTFGVFPNNFLVLQYDIDGVFDGLIAFDTEEKMLEFFTKVEE